MLCVVHPDCANEHLPRCVSILKAKYVKIQVLRRTVLCRWHAV